MTVDQFTAQLDGFGEEAQDLTQILSQIAADITNEIKANLRTGPNAKGNLKRSIIASADPDGFEIEMLAYGVPQNYGVKGTRSSFGGIKAIEEGLPDSGKTMTFGTYQTIGGDLPFGLRKHIAEKGIRPKNFFDMDDIKTEVAQRITQALTNNFN